MSNADRRRQVQNIASYANPLLPGLYAWVATVGYPATAPAATALSRLTAVAALGALIGGCAIAPRHPTWGRRIGVLAFIALSVATWLLSGPNPSGKLDPLSAALGTVGWVLFAFGWGSLRKLGSVPEDDPNVVMGPALRSRHHRAGEALPVLALSSAGAVLVLLLAWRTTRPTHALFAHSVALLCAIWLVSAGGSIATDTARRDRRSPFERIRAAAAPLVGLALLLSLGLLWVLYRA